MKLTVNIPSGECYSESFDDSLKLQTLVESIFARVGINSAAAFLRGDPSADGNKSETPDWFSPSRRIQLWVRGSDVLQSSTDRNPCLSAVLMDGDTITVCVPDSLRSVAGESLLRTKVLLEALKSDDDGYRKLSGSCAMSNDDRTTAIKRVYAEQLQHSSEKQRMPKLQDISSRFTVGASSTSDSGASGRDIEDLMSLLPAVPAEKLQQLKDMGFSEEHSRKALLLNRMNSESAINFLLENSGAEELDLPLTAVEIRQIVNASHVNRQRVSIFDLLQQPDLSSLRGASGVSDVLSELVDMRARHDGASSEHVDGATSANVPPIPLVSSGSARNALEFLLQFHRALGGASVSGGDGDGDVGVGVDAEDDIDMDDTDDLDPDIHIGRTNSGEDGL